VSNPPADGKATRERFRPAWAAIGSVLAAVIFGFGAGWIFAPCRTGCGVNWTSWLSTFVTSPGFGGLAAVFAAGIAFAAARRSALEAARQAKEDRDQRNRAERKAQWWARAEWALNLIVSGDTEQATIGHGMLRSLAESEWADEHEADVIAAATDEALTAVPESSTQGRQFARLWRRGR
jgi:hypothetical protein